jgi:D-alanyl-D-alanine carboxypeptidase/D-alanyl-D-alanine-endopeptidase (penicillin-binding protein 4)
LGSILLFSFFNATLITLSSCNSVVDQNEGLSQAVFSSKPSNDADQNERSNLDDDTKTLYPDNINDQAILTDHSNSNNQSLQSAITNFDNLEWMQKASWSFAIRDAKGSILASKDLDRLLTPASIQKLVATALALQQFGPSTKWPTILSYSGLIENNILRGDIIIEGKGDPSLGSNRIDIGTQSVDQVCSLWVDAIKKAQIKEIQGNIIGTGKILGEARIPEDWAWNDIGNYFGPALNGLSIGDNQLILSFKSGAPGTKAVLLNAKPLPAGLQIITKVTAGPKGSGDNAWAYSAPGASDVIMRGNIPPYQPSFKVRIAFPNPELAAADILKEALLTAGIKIKGKSIAGDLASKTKALFTLESPELSEIIKITNQQSLNGYAEILARQLALTHGDPSPESVPDALEAGLTKLGIDKSNWVLKDGSGLSRSNKVNARGITELLYKASSSSWKDEFISSLPTAGESGTLKNTFIQGTGKLKAKTGSMSGVQAWAGYVQTQNKEWYSFSIIINNQGAGGQTVKREVEKLFQAMLEFP